MLMTPGRVIVFLLPISIFSLTSFIFFSFSRHENVLAESGLFKSDEILELVLQSDFAALLNDRGEDPDYHKGIIYYTDQQGDNIVVDCELRTRGHFRRNPAHCRYPPIRVKITDSPPEDYLFRNQDKLKLVVQCQIEENVLMEYLAYRIYNQLTDLSFRVRLARITYQDLATNQTYTTKYGFFLESVDELSARLKMVEYEPHIIPNFLERNEGISMAVFEFLIGNDDWALTSEHNVVVLHDTLRDQLFAVPYDFDWSELVDAEYTKPEGIPDWQLSDRNVYKGLCMTENDYEYQMQFFNNKKTDVLAMIDMVPDLTKNRRQKARRYIENSYAAINKNNALNTIFQKQPCVGKTTLERN